MKKLFVFLLALSAVANIAVAQAPASLSVADYERAEKFLNYNTSPLIDRLGVQANSLPDGRFWYRVLTPEGSEFIIVDPRAGTKRPAFDHAKLAAALGTAADKTFTAARLPFRTMEIASDGAIVVDVAGKRYSCDAAAASCKVVAVPQARPADPNAIASPDGKREVFIREHNLWVREKETGKETQLTKDGIKDFGYATDNAGWRKSDRPVVLWSPDSKKVATFQQDQRGVSDMYLVSTNVGAPRLEAWKYPLPGDAVVTTIQRVIIDVETGRTVRLQLPADQHRSTLCDDISCSGSFDDNEWSKDSKTLAFVSSSRDHKNAKLRVADVETGAVRLVLEETVATQFESGQDRINWRYLPESNEVIWYSERDDWGHLYLYDLATGKLKQQITKGNWTISQLLRVDERTRTLYFLGLGREQGRNPYFAHLYKVGFDGNGLTLLTPEDANHAISLFDDRDYFIDTYSKRDVEPTTVLRDLNGKVLVELEKADISRLRAAGWKPPTPVTVKARDGVTDLYGIMYTPTNLDPAKKYPIIDNIYPGPQGGSVGTWSFVASFGDNQSLAELGFIVVQIEGTCNPLRSKKFHDACYGNMADNTLLDQITAIQQLAERYPYIDISRVGIWGHSGGGFATAAAMFRYPDFFKVGISESGNHDNRNYEDDWGERYIGLLTKDASGKSNYEDQANQNYAKNLKGKLLLAHGTMDNNVPPYNTYLVVDALIKANKDFDLIMIPNARHGYGLQGMYMMRRRWDYFVKNLLGAEPPKEYELKAKPDPRNALP
jgi:dipeptidyl aminopeptidase/acylaminoacyl peptidase